MTLDSVCHCLGHLVGERGGGAKNYTLSNTQEIKIPFCFYAAHRGILHELAKAFHATCITCLFCAQKNLTFYTARLNISLSSSQKNMLSLKGKGEKGNPTTTKHVHAFRPLIQLTRM